LTLGYNTRLVLSDPADARSAVERPRAITPETVTRELAWREGKLAFEGETLKQAADTFARYSGTRIQIRDADLAREPVTGLFAANDPVGFSRAIARVFDAKLEQDGGDVVLTRAAAQGSAAQ
jgi:transmembrane sensor